MSALGNRQKRRRSDGHWGRPGHRVTKRDLEIVRWVARMRFAKVDQIARRFGMGRTASYRRVKALRQAGLVRMSPAVFGDGPGVVLATRPGLEATWSDLQLPRIDARQFAHDRELVELCIDYELDGATVYSDREVRSLGRRPVRATDQSFAFEVSSPNQRGFHVAYYKHFPDLIVCQDGIRTAVELEIAAKGKYRLKEILRAYEQNIDIDQVLYLATNPAVLKRIAGLIEEHRIWEKAQVRTYRERSR